MAERRPDRTLGPGHDEFWGHCAAGELRLPACGQCGHLAWPPVPACEVCGHGSFAWRRMAGGGTVVATCAFHQDYYGGVLPLPYETILVALDEGPLFVSDPHGFAEGEERTGARVRVAFVDGEDDAGRFRLPVFAPA